MTDVMSTEVDTVSVTEPEMPPALADAVDEQLVGQLVERARASGLQLTGEGGLLQQLTKRVLESALEGEITDHLGYDKHDPAGRNGGNSRNGTRCKTVLTEVGPVPVDVPRDRDGSFEPQIVRKRQRRLSGVEDMVLSLSAKGLTTGEISSHLAEVYGAQVSKQTIWHDHRQGHGRDGRVAEPAAGSGVSGDLPGRRAREDPRRKGCQPADLRRSRGHRGRYP
jgi:hypothetical protein